MILPGSELYNLILLAIGMLCLGTWANTYRMTSKWRFELYYFDFAVGVLLAALIIGFTFGSLGWDGFALMDDLRIAGKKKFAFALAAGGVFNLGNMLIIGALSVSGVTIAYLSGIGMMLASGMLITSFFSSSGNGAMTAGGAALLLVSAVVLTVAFRQQAMARLVTMMREGKTKSTKKVVSMTGQILAIVGGIVAGGFFPLVNAARSGENGLGPYSLGLFFAAGILITTFVYNLFFMNLPIRGEPLEFTAYFNGKGKFHVLGFLGGALFYGWLCTMFVAARAEGANIVPPVVGRALMLGAVAIGVIWGLLRWKEFGGAPGRTRTLLTVALLVFIVGAAGLSAAAGISMTGS
jgi:glucose uptake protein